MLGKQTTHNLLLIRIQSANAMAADALRTVPYPAKPPAAAMGHQEYATSILSIVQALSIRYVDRCPELLSPQRNIRRSLISPTSDGGRPVGLYILKCGR